MRQNSDKTTYTDTYGKNEETPKGLNAENISLEAPHRSRKVSFHTLGCKLNFSETSTIAREFESGGFVRVSPGEEADVCVVNTCSVTEHADKKCRNLIRSLHRRNPQAIIAVTGCYAQLSPQEIAAIEGVSLVLGNNDKGETFRRVMELGSKAEARVYSCETGELTQFFASFSSGDRTRAFLKVQDGCDYNCTYCTIPYARGASRNISISRIADEARKIAAEGQREIVLTGINTGDFGRTTGESFLDLIAALDTVEGIERYRISSIEPNLLTDRIIEFCAQSAKFQPHFHIPLQSGSDAVLKRMGRRYTTAKFEERIAAVRRLMPDTFFGIDVIVGFPGESDEGFEETYALLERISPAYLHVFPYSERRGTPAAAYGGKVKDSVKTERARRLGKLCERLHAKFCDSYAGTQNDVLFESSAKKGFMYGFTANYIRVKAPYDKSRVNTICRVLIGGGEDKNEIPATILE